MGATKLATRRTLTSGEAQAIATELGIDFGQLGCDLEQFRMGLDVELEHGSRNHETDVSGNDPSLTGKIALAHLTEYPDYYTRLAILEREATAQEPGETAAKVRAPGIPHGDEELGGAIAGGVAGAVIGSVLGGPVGAVIGGVIGAASGAAAGAIDEKSKDETIAH